MEILDARTDFPGTPLECLTVLVDRIPSPYELDYYAYPLDQPTSTLYVATTSDGYITYMVETADPSGSYGRPHPIRIIGGTHHVVHGPWSGNPDTVRTYAPNVDLYDGQVRLHDKPTSFYDGPGGGHTGHLTFAAAHRARAIAARHPSRPGIPADDETLHRLLADATPAAASQRPLALARAIAIATLGQAVADVITWEHTYRDGRLYGHLRNGITRLTIWHEPGHSALFTGTDCPADPWRCRDGRATVIGPHVLLNQLNGQPNPHAACPTHQPIPA